MIAGLHHSAYRCKNAEETRKFYEDFLELPLAGALRITETKTGRDTDVLHIFFEMKNGSYMAFFEAPDPFEFKDQHDFDLHIALEVAADELHYFKDKAEREGRDVRGPVDHDFIHSIYFRDPNGYVIELSAKTPDHDDLMNPDKNKARAIVDQWNQDKGYV